MMIFYIFVSISFILCQDPYNKFDFLSTYFKEEVGSNARNSCPFVGLNGARYCPSKNFLHQECDALSTELITYDTVTHGVRYPIIDLEQSRANSVVHNTMKEITFYSNFSTVEEYYDFYMSFEPGKPFRNGMFHSFDEVVKFFDENFGNAKYPDANLTVSQQEFVSIEKSVKLEDVVLKESVQRIIDKFLPIDYNEGQYAKFVEEFGTQTALSCRYGGLVEIQLLVKDCLPVVLEHGKILSSVEDELNRVSKDDRTRKGDPDYVQRSEVKIRAVYGGDPTEEKFSKRIPTFPKDPVVTTCEFVGIDKVVANVDKRKNLQKYLSGYLQKPQKDREEQYRIVKEKKQKLWLATPMPIILVSEADYRYTPIFVKTNQLSGPHRFHYGNAPNIDFYCGCDSSKLCRCQQKVTSRRFIRRGVSDIGKFAYRWEDKYRCGKCLWLWKCCHHHYEIDSKTWGAINCEKIYKDKKGDILCSCGVF